MLGMQQYVCPHLQSPGSLIQCFSGPTSPDSPFTEIWLKLLMFVSPGAKRAKFKFGSSEPTSSQLLLGAFEEVARIASILAQAQARLKLGFS
jgi:hypothetical protein